MQVPNSVDKAWINLPSGPFARLRKLKSDYSRAARDPCTKPRGDFTGTYVLFNVGFITQLWKAEQR